MTTYFSPWPLGAARRSSFPEITTYYLSPKEDFGIPPTKRSAVERVADAKQNAEDIFAILHNAPGALSDLTLINAAGALKASINLPYKDGVELARESLASGKAYQKLKEFLKVSSNNTEVLEQMEESL